MCQLIFTLLISSILISTCFTFPTLPTQTNGKPNLRPFKATLSQYDLSLLEPYSEQMDYNYEHYPSLGNELAYQQEDYPSLPMTVGSSRTNKRSSVMLNRLGFALQKAAHKTDGQRRSSVERLLRPDGMGHKFSDKPGQKDIMLKCFFNSVSCF